MELIQKTKELTHILGSFELHDVMLIRLKQLPFDLWFRPRTTLYPGEE
jgi:hypothetical protein